jgi:hypothetical protein
MSDVNRPTYYKSLTADGIGPYSAVQWPGVGMWIEAHEPGDLVACENGIHVCDKTNLIDWLCERIYTVECDPDPVLLGLPGKLVARRARLIEETLWDERRARIFAAHCALDVLHLYEAEHDDARPREAIQAALAFADGSTTADDWDAAREAAWDAASDAANAAAWDAASDAAWDAANAAANAAARDAASAAARDAAWAAAWAAAWDAAREWQSARLQKALHDPGWPG